MTSPLSLMPLVLQRLACHHEGGDAAFHVGDAEALDLVADDAAVQLRFRLHVRDHARGRRWCR